jgi:hypothetical protein
VSGPPDPKSRSLARGERRYRRKVASPKQWQAIIAAKRGQCRVCSLSDANVVAVQLRGFTEYHHLVERDAPHFGDDVADNIVPLHPACHEAVTAGVASARLRLGESLSDAERAYVVGKLGESGSARLFGVTRGGL